MYKESVGSRKTVGDVDIIFHDGIYHLFHLVLPNHDYVAHAVSNDCFNWRRVENALFIGHPGAWDDSMLWTVHVSPHPYREATWRMFYTGLSRRDKGLKQRIGMAESNDLYTWTKAPVNWTDRRSELPYRLEQRPPQPPFRSDPKSGYPIGPDPEYYEASVSEGRNWVSWRDPFYYREGDRGWLLCAGRVNHGPIVRRGCVAVLEETEENQFVAKPPLHHPGLYDDIEVPNLLCMDDHYYLIGSIREDAKIRYWHTDRIGSPWRSHYDNVLLAAGNYAGRICSDDKGLLLWSFFSEDSQDRTTQNLMPPPKRIHRVCEGNLELRTFEGFDDRVAEPMDVSRVCPMNPRDGDQCITGNGRLNMKSVGGFQAFLFDEDAACFRLSTSIQVDGTGKCGFVFRINRETHDGYYLSLDLHKGVAQVRAWGTNQDGEGESMMQFRTLQQGYWKQCDHGTNDMVLIAHGSYIELSIDGAIVLSLADQTFEQGAIGVYVESTQLQLIETQLERLHSPLQADEHLAEG